MSIKNSTSSKVIKSTAAVGGVLAVAFVPQYADASIVTVGGDGGTGSVTLSNSGDSTNLGGALVNSIFFNSFSSSTFTSFTSPGNSSLNFSTNIMFQSGAIQPNFIGNDELFSAVRSSNSTSGLDTGRSWNFYDFGAAENALLGSSNNWVPGTFQVNGVNGGEAVWGWLQVELGSSFENLDPTIISFTYDDEATDATPFAKPEGGFSVDGTAVPEPSSLPLLTLLALGAAGLRRHRKCTSDSSRSA